MEVPFGEALAACGQIAFGPKELPAEQLAPNQPVLAGGPDTNCPTAPTIGSIAPGLMAALWLDPCDTQGSSPVDPPNANAGPQVIMVESTPANAPLAGPTTNPVDKDDDDDDDGHTPKSNKGKDDDDDEDGGHDKKCGLELSVPFGAAFDDVAMRSSGSWALWAAELIGLNGDAARNPPPPNKNDKGKDEKKKKCH